MKTSTLVAIKAIFESDPARTSADRQMLLRTLGLEEPGEPCRPADKVVSFEEAAKRLNRTTRTVHLLARRGALRKAKMPGCVRCAGVLASDLEALLVRMVEGDVVPGAADENRQR